MSRRWLLLALAAVGAVQIAVPLGQIAGYERTLAQGSEWRFRVTPVDPADAFRGRYLALGFEVEAEGLPTTSPVEHHQWVHVSLAEDAEGFARLTELAETPPAEGEHLRLRVLAIRTDPGGSEAWVDLPFERLYLPEGLAPAAEARLRAGFNEPGARDRVWAVVRVRDGRGVLEDLVIDGVSGRQR